MADKVNAAISECLQECQQAPDVQLAALQFLTRLRKHPDWTHDEVNQVRVGVVGLLSQKRD
jgi:hypothetical protein